MGTPTMIESQTFGERMIFVRTADETNGELLEIEARYSPAPGWEGVPYHLHPNQDEHFEVLEGMMTVEVAGTKRTYVAGEEFDVPRGTEHAMRNMGSVPARIRWQIRPALQTQQFFETSFGLSDRGTLYHPLQMAVMIRAYSAVFQLTRVPSGARLLVPMLAVIGRLLGYRAYYDSFRATPAETTAQGGAEEPGRSKTPSLHTAR